jgi:hypothetical protein
VTLQFICAEIERLHLQIRRQQKEVSRVSYSDIQAYLEAVADDPDNKRSVDNSAHERFWNVPYAQFVNGTVPNESCNGSAIPIANKDPNKCSFYQALKVRRDGVTYPKCRSAARTLLILATRLR